MKIIAECGCNWKDLNEAKEMIKSCREIGVDLVKFQLFSKEYAQNNDIPLYLSLTYEQATELYKYGESINQTVIFTPFDLKRVKWLMWRGYTITKIREKDNKKYNLIKRAYAQNVYSLIISVNSIRRKIILTSYFSDILFLFCVPKYPAPYKEYSTMPLGSFDGISDHTKGLDLLKTLQYKQNEFNLLNNIEFFEKHVKLRDDCLETEWSVFIEDLGEVIQ